MSNLAFATTSLLFPEFFPFKSFCFADLVLRDCFVLYIFCEGLTHLNSDKIMSVGLCNIDLVGTLL